LTGKLGIVGAGTMGYGIASISGLNGFAVVVYDIENPFLERAGRMIEENYRILVTRQKISGEESKKALANISFTNNINKLSDCEFIIEAATENIEVKRSIFSELNAVAEPEAILASNTSSLSIAALSAAVKKNRSRVVGMHFFNPANVMKLVEVVKGEFTSDETIERTVELSKKLGKTPVVCKDTPAFIVNRVARPFYGEALKMLGERKLSVKQIDAIMKQEGGFKLGPFELMDLIGIDVNYSVTKSVYEAFYQDPKYKPSPIQAGMVQAGMLGKKTGKGFYSY
jgi:3-hydroxybutyryl-CoA dehydrogenase